jgi:hypothetical protein
LAEGGGVWFSIRRQRSGGACEPALHGVGVDQACLLKLKVAAGEYGEVGNALHVVARGELGELLCIDLKDDGLAGEIARDLGDMGRRHAAGTAPGRPEIDEDGNFAVADDFVELLRCDGEGIGDGREWRLAGAAASCIGEVVRRDSIRLSAGWAISDDGHGDVLCWFRRIHSISRARRLRQRLNELVGIFESHAIGRSAMRLDSNGETGRKELSRED